jgi:signal transduction histidine kinase
MLQHFVAANREELVRRCRAKVEVRSVPRPTPAALEFGVPRFLDQLVDALPTHLGSNLAIHDSAAQHGRDLQLQGFTVSQVVHDYGDVCQSITELAMDTGAPISVGDFRVLNRCLDDAIASAVTAYGRERPLPRAGVTAPSDRARVGCLVHEIRNLVNAATVAFEVLNAGNVGVGGSMGAVLTRSLSGLRELINRAVAEVRLGQGLQDPVTIGVRAFIDELTPAAILEAANRGLHFTVHAADANVAVRADRQILAAIVTNLLQNACTFTRPRTSVCLRVSASTDRVLIEIEDECGGLADGNAEALFQAFERRSADRTGLGFGLAFSRWGADVNGGRISTRNLPGHGCVFGVDLPRVPMPSLATA